MNTWFEICEIISGYRSDDSSFSQLKPLLESKQADLNRRDASGRTLLDYTILPTLSYTPFKPNMLEDSRYRGMRIASLLIKYGSDINSTDKEGWTVIHQCAVVGNLTMLQFFIHSGAKVTVANNEGKLPIDLALMKGHTPIVRYLEVQSKSLRCLCRLSIREAMGKRTYNRINELPLPSSLLLFVNYGNPYPGWAASIYVPRPWSNNDIIKGTVDKQEVLEFLDENASKEFIEERCDVTKKLVTSDELAELVEALYFWEAFKTIDYEEPVARKPRYSLEKIPDDGENKVTNKLTNSKPTRFLNFFNRH